MIELYKGDCLEIMDQLIEKEIKVDAIITDPPYGTTACKWDVIIPFDEMWPRLKSLRKEKAPILLHASVPFNYLVYSSNPKEYKYDWYWKKEQATGFALANKQPMRFFEHIMVFYKNQPYYNKIGEKLNKPRNVYIKNNTQSKSSCMHSKKYINKTVTYEYSTPTNLLEFNRERGLHPTQKPVALLEYLIKTYTKEGDLVLDFTAGSGTTGVACQNLNRNCILIEEKENYCRVIENRLCIKRLA